MLLQGRRSNSIMASELLARRLGSVAGRVRQTDMVLPVHVMGIPMSTTMRAT